MKKSTVFKGISIAREERAMLNGIASYSGSATMTEVVCNLLQTWPKNKKLTEPPTINRDDMMSTTVSLSMPDMNRLNKLCAEYGMRGGKLIRAVVRSYYTEHEQEITAMTGIPAESESEIEIPAEPTATQMPLPEPLSEAEAIAARIEAERMHNPVEFRGDLLKVLGRIADGLDALNKSRSADSAEIGRITNQLKTLNNAVWNR